MSTNLWLKSTYTTGLDIITQIDAWLVGTMNYTRDSGPIVDGSDGYRAHYSYTFPTGQSGSITFKTVTSLNHIHITASKGYSSSAAWDDQPNRTRTYNGSVIAPMITYVPNSSKMLYMFGDLYGNIQIFIQKGVKFDSTSLIQFGVIDKTGFGSWNGGVYISAFDLGPVYGSKLESEPYFASPTLIANGSNNLYYFPRFLIDVEYDNKSIWTGVYNHYYSGSNEGRLPSLLTLSADTNAAKVSTELMAFSDINVEYGSYTRLYLQNYDSGLYQYAPNVTTFTNMQDVSGYVCSMTGRIFMYSPVIYIRHEVTKRVSAIGRMPFGFHCPVASISSMDAIVAGTEIVQNGRTFVLMGNIAAEKVVR